MVDARDPAVQQRRLRFELRQTRISAGLSQKDVAQALEWSLSKVIRLEQGGVRVSITDLRALLSQYGVHDPDTVERLLETARQSRRKPWWTDYAALLRPSFVRFLEIEAASARTRMFQSHVVPGLLQTPGYVQAMIGSCEPAGSAVDQFVEIRRRRQELLDDDTRHFTFLLDEGVLKRIVGDAEILREQFEHLVVMNQRDTVDISVLPFTCSAHPAAVGSFTVAEVPVGPDDGDDVDVLVWLHGSLRDALIKNDPAQVGAHVEAFEQLAGLSVPIDRWVRA